VTGARLCCHFCLLLLLAAAPVHAALNCRVSTPTLAFGNYNAGTSQNLDTSADVQLRCQGGTGVISIALSAGSSGDQEDRFMVSGGGSLSYNAYLNAARTIIWGDGSGSTSVVTRIQTRPRRTIYTIPVYGRIFADQSPTPGTYSDSVVVTAYF